MRTAEPLVLPPRGHGLCSTVVALAVGIATDVALICQAGLGINRFADLQPIAAALVVANVLGLAAIAYPVHEAVHGLAYVLAGVPAREVEVHLNSTHAPGRALRRWAYLFALAAPYPLLLATAWLCARHVVTLLLGLGLFALAPLTALGDLHIARGVIRNRSKPLWEDRKEATRGWERSSTRDAPARPDGSTRRWPKPARVVGAAPTADADSASG